MRGICHSLSCLKVAGAHDKERRRLLGAEASAWLTAHKEKTTSFPQPQGDEFCKQPVSLKEDPELHMRTTAPNNTLISAWWDPEQSI